MSQEELQSKSLLAHINDLRRTLFFCLAVVLIAFIVIFTFFSKTIVSEISKPITAQNISIIYTDVSEAFASQLKLSLIASVIVTSPIIMVAVWLFIRPALYKSERLLFGTMFIFAFLLFIGGSTFSYFMVFNLAINFFVQSGDGIAMPLLSLSQYVSFLFSFILPFGLMFQLPIVVVLFTRIGLCTPKLLKTIRKYIVLLVFIVAAILTPPDVVSQLLLAIPILVLYEFSVLLSYLVKPKDVNFFEMKEKNNK